LLLLLIAILINLIGPVGYDHQPVDRLSGPRLDSLISAVGMDHEDGIDPRRAVFLFEPIDLNLAGIEVLSSLKGIGPKLAARIVSHRQLNGGFRDVSELLEVKGIGKRKLQAIMEEVSVILINEESK
jgi:competence ComEA-like helix-hairpin-helix protein